MTVGVTRRLVAIFYADVAGYSRLTGADEEGTHRRVMSLLDEVTIRISERRQRRTNTIAFS